MSTWKIAVERERERERERELLALKANSSDLSRPPGGGVITPSCITPSCSCDTPQPSEVQRGLSGGVYGGCLCDRDGRVINVVKY